MPPRAVDDVGALAAREEVVPEAAEDVVVPQAARDRVARVAGVEDGLAGEARARAEAAQGADRVGTAEAPCLDHARKRGRQRHVAVAVVVQRHAALADGDRVRRRWCRRRRSSRTRPPSATVSSISGVVLSTSTPGANAPPCWSSVSVSLVPAAPEIEIVSVLVVVAAPQATGVAPNWIAPPDDAERRLLARSDRRRHGPRRRVVDARPGGRRRWRRARRRSRSPRRPGSRRGRCRRRRCRCPLRR